jgi:hypothetical protein
MRFEKAISSHRELNLDTGPKPVKGPSCLSVMDLCGPRPDFLLLSDRWSFVDVGRPLWREDVSYGLTTVFFCLRFETPPTWRTRSHVFISPKRQGSPVIPPNTAIHFRRPLRLAGPWWRYSNRSYTGNSTLKPEHCISIYNLSVGTLQNTTFTVLLLL